MTAMTASGGLLIYGIPGFKLEKEVVSAAFRNWSDRRRASLPPELHCRRDARFDAICAQSMTPC
jgi:hypothetical protein